MAEGQEAQADVRTVKIRRRYYIDIVAIGLALSCAIAAVYLEVPLTYVVSASTERVTIRSEAPGAISQWYLNDIEINRACENNWEPFSGTVRIEPATVVIVERIARGSLLIDVRPATDAASKVLARLEHEESSEISVAQQCFSITVDDLEERSKRGQTVVLPINGYIEVGRRPRHETIQFVPLLRSGSVRVVGQTLLGGATYDAGTLSLGMGDEFVLEEPTSGSGLVVADQNPGLKVVSHTAGARAFVRRFGAQPQKISASLWVRIERDPTITALVAATVFILSTLVSLRKWFRRQAGDEQA